MNIEEIRSYTYVQKVTTYGLHLILIGGGGMNAYCNGVNFIDNKLYTMKPPLGYCRFVSLMNPGFPSG